MKRPTTHFHCIFLDIGGVVLTDGWDRHARKLAATDFQLDGREIEIRHHLNFSTYEEGKLTLDDYLDRVVFYKKRPFSKSRFRDFMLMQSKPHVSMIEFVTRLKHLHRLKIIAVSNEARELNEYRINKFKLNKFIDAFVSSCFVHLRKPDTDIFRLALDIGQVQANEVIYIENTPMFVEIAEGIGIQSILHTSYKSTRAKLASHGLVSDKAIDEER